MSHDDLVCLVHYDWLHGHCRCEVFLLQSDFSAICIHTSSVCNVYVSFSVHQFGQSHEEYLEYFLVFATAILVWTEFGFYEVRVRKSAISSVFR